MLQLLRDATGATWDGFLQKAGLFAGAVFTSITGGVIAVNKVRGKPGNRRGLDEQVDSRVEERVQALLEERLSKIQTQT